MAMSDNGNGIPRLLTVEQVAEMWQLPRSWVYERTRRRGIERLPHLKLGKYVRFEEKAVRQFLEQRQVGTKPSD